MRSFDGFFTARTRKDMVAEKFRSAYQHFQYVGDNAHSDEGAFFQEQLPPVSVVNEYVSEFNSGDQFHSWIPDLSTRVVA